MDDEKLLDESEKVLVAYKRLFETNDGQIVLEDLMKSCFFTKPTFSDSPQEFAFNEGQRAVVLRIIETLRTDVGTYKRQVEEFLKQQGENTWGF